jgi:hypothetical protein
MDQWGFDETAVHDWLAENDDLEWDGRSDQRWLV